MRPPALQAWHDIVDSQSAHKLDALLADDVVFHSPVVHTPQRGKLITMMYLSAASQVLFSEKFKYLREAIEGNSAFLEFATEIEGITINGVDIITWNDAGKITEFKVLLRPLKAVNLIHRLMGEMLEKAQKTAGA